MTGNSNCGPKHQVWIFFTDAGVDLGKDFLVDIVHVTGSERGGSVGKNRSADVCQDGKNAPHTDFDSDKVSGMCIQSQKSAFTSGTGRFTDFVSGFHNCSFRGQISCDGGDQSRSQAGIVCNLYPVSLSGSVDKLQNRGNMISVNI